MKALALLSLVAASLAAAQPIPLYPFGSGFTPANSPNIVQATTADLTLYVDPLGNDGNTCTSTGAAACLTIQGGLNKFPKMLRHRETLNIAAGSYGGFYISGFSVDTGVQQTTAGLLINGTLANSTLATGSATGTATGGTAGSTSTFGTLIDAGATWTTNDLTGRIINTLTPTNNSYIISSNTGTTITVVGLWTVPTGSTTYVISDPATIVTGLVAAPPSATAVGVANRTAIGINSNNISYRENAIGLQNIRVANATGGIAVEINDTSTIVLTQMQLRPGANTAQALVINTLTGALNPRVQVSKVDIFLTSSNNGAQLISGQLNSLNSLWRNATAASGAAIQIGSGTNGLAKSAQLSQSEFRGFLHGVQIINGFVQNFGNSRIICSGATGIAATVGQLTIGTVGVPSSSTISAIDVATCGVGLQANGGVNVDVVSMSGAAATTGFNLAYGANVSYTRAGMTMTAGTHEIDLDATGADAATSTFAGVAAGDCAITAKHATRACGR